MKMWETGMWFFKKNKKKECEFIKMDNKKKLLLMEKIIYFKNTKIIKINDIYKVSSFQIISYW